MSMYSSTTGRPRTVPYKTRGGKRSPKKKSVKDEMTVQVKSRKRTEPLVPEKKEIEISLRPPVDPLIALGATEPPGRTRSNPIVYEAMDLLRTYGYEPVRLSEPKIPINIIALKKSGSLLVFAVRSRLPVPSAAKLRELFTGRVDYLRAMVNKVREKIMIWVYSPACGWRHYLVYPGGLRYDHGFPVSLG